MYAAIVNDRKLEEVRKGYLWVSFITDTFEECRFEINQNQEFCTKEAEGL